MYNKSIDIPLGDVLFQTTQLEQLAGKEVDNLVPFQHPGAGRLNAQAPAGVFIQLRLRQDAGTGHLL